MMEGKEIVKIIERIFDNDIKGQNSTQIQVNCPRCQEREGLTTPDGKYNLEINTEKRVFRCWKCDEPKFSGRLGKLIHFFGNSFDKELYDSLGGDDASYYYYSGEKEDEEEQEYYITLPKEFIPFSKMDENNPEHMEAYQYLVLERKLTREIILKYRLGFCLDGRYKFRIIVPSFDKYGNINYFVGRSFRKNLKPSYLNPKVDKNKIIFNEGYINWDSTIYLVEGAFEMLSFPVNPAVLLGKNLPNLLFNELKQKQPPVVVVLDPDAYYNAIRICEKLKSVYDNESLIKIVKLEGDDDLDEIKRNGGNVEVVKNLYGARNLVLDDYFIGRKYYKNDWRRRNYSFNK